VGGLAVGRSATEATRHLEERQGPLLGKTKRLGIDIAERTDAVDPPAHGVPRFDGNAAGPATILGVRRREEKGSHGIGS